MDYNVWFVVRVSSVSLYLLIPQYDYLASLTCYYYYYILYIYQPKHKLQHSASRQRVFCIKFGHFGIEI